MNPLIKRFVGISFIIFALLGIVISLVGIYGTWQVRSNLLTKLFETTEIINDTLSTTYNGMTVLNDTLDEAMETIESSERVMFAMAQTIGDINDLTSGFLGMINLRFPGMQGSNDAPEGDGPISDFSVVETEIENIARNVNQVNSAMKDAQEVVGSYQEVINTTQGQIQDFQENGPKWITTSTWVLTILLFWFAITQVGFIIQGLEFINSAKEIKVDDNVLITED
jgi:hypothetical protein